MESFRRELINKDLSNQIKFLKGKVADLGGSRAIHARSNIKKTNNIEKIVVINIDEKSKPDIVANLEKIPVSENYYDSFLLIEVLEHVENIQQVINEINRVISINAKGFVSIPFLYQIHEAPDDYRRWTKKKIINFFNQNGFKILLIKENGGIFSVIFDLLRSFILNLDNNKIFTKLCFKILRIIKPFFRLLDNKTIHLSKTITTGYFLVVEKIK